MRDQHSAVIAQDIHLVGIDANEHLLVSVLRPGGVIMLPVQADPPIAVCLEPFIAADGECLPRQRAQRGMVFLEKRSNADAFLVMRLLCFHVVPLQELAVVDMEILDSRDWDEEIGADIADLALYIALLVTRIWIAELHAAPIMRAEAPEQLRLMHLAADPLANARGIVEDQKRRDTANVLEDVPQALAETFRRLTAEYLREAVVAVRE